LHEEACVIFKAGKNHDGYFTAEDLLVQVNHAIDIFEAKTNCFTTRLFLFDNTPTHQKHAPDALLAHYMPKNLSPNWTHSKDSVKMQSTVLMNGKIQHFYYDKDHLKMPGWFKGMKQIILK
ncbi:hypothetical protein AX16_010820, partial [Volvariella volvacea WC 439]